MIKDYKVGVAIGRYQTSELHIGHKAVLNTVIENHDKIILFIGCSRTPGSTHDPLDFISRKKMIDEYLLECDKFSYRVNSELLSNDKKVKDVFIIPITDQREDSVWSSILDSKIDETFPSEKALLYGGRDSFIKHYSGKNDVFEIDEVKSESATEIRDRISKTPKQSKDWREGIIYGSYNRYPVSYQTVDIAVFNEDETEILLGKKPGESKWRLIGGFVDPSDTSLELAAKREFREEAGFAEISMPSYVGSFRVDDWRYRQSRDKIMTTLFKSKYIFGHLSPSDDISEIGFFKIDSLEGMIMDEHIPLIKALIEKR